MKKNVVLTICILALIAMWNLQFGRDMEVYNSFTTSADNFEMASLNVVVNRLWGISNFARENKR